jgi:hypothetical protein
VVRPGDSVGQILNAYAKVIPGRQTGDCRPPAAGQRRRWRRGVSCKLPRYRVKRHEQLGQPLRQPLDVVDHRVPPPEDIADVVVGLAVEADAVGEDSLLVEFSDRLAGVFDQQALVLNIDVGRLAVGQDQQQFLLGFLLRAR